MAVLLDCWVRFGGIVPVREQTHDVKGQKVGV